VQKIVTFLWFDHQAEEAANFYVSVFSSRPGAVAGSSEVVDVARYSEAGPGEPGSAMTVSFRLEGQEFTALNGGPAFAFTEAISLYVSCENQEEVDDLWTKLTDGGEESMCGWLKDRYGLSWQIIPKQLIELMSDPDPAKSQAVVQAMLKMQKIDVADLQRAHRAA
jgi:predicted 3-demethylubiquinone-9 3-methyltransferase (glyoxalase superfamily)